MKPRDWTALVLAVGLTLSLNIIVLAVLWDAARSNDPGLSENATQLMTMAFGGIIGVLGSYIGALPNRKNTAPDPGGSGAVSGGGAES